MELKPSGSNMTTLTLNDGTEILFSYETPVAGFGRVAEGQCGNCFFRTDKWYSKTTTRHITKYLDGARAIEAPHEQILNLVI